VKRGFAAIAAGFLAVQSLAAQTPSALINLAGAETAAALMRGETPSALQFDNPRAALVPLNSHVQNIVDELIRSLKPGFFAESLSLFHKPASRARPWTEAERTALYNEALALSSLAGLQYYSASRGETRTFYETSSVVSGSGGNDSKKTLPDPVYAVPPPELTVYARQKDLSFGDNVYRYDYYARPDSLVFVQENITTMWYGIIPAVGKNKLRSMVAVIDADEYLLIYIASMAKAASVAGMNDRVGRSFSNRAGAVLKWFSGQADKAFLKAER
jgi:hypothetical protein